MPHIYSREELSAIFKAADSYQSTPESPGLPLVLSVMLRLIYCCGLRPVEARRLRVEDVDLETGSIKILESKGHKDRIVVMHKDMLKLARKYELKFSQIYPNRKYFFSPPRRYNEMYSQPWLNSRFQKFYRKRE